MIFIFHNAQLICTKKIILIGSAKNVCHDWFTYTKNPDWSNWDESDPDLQLIYGSNIYILYTVQVSISRLQTHLHCRKTLDAYLPSIPHTIHLRPHGFHQVSDGVLHFPMKELGRGNQTIAMRIQHWRLLTYELEKILPLETHINQHPIPHINTANTQMHRLVILHQLQNHTSPFRPFFPQRFESHCIFITTHTIGTKLSIPEKIIKNVQSQTSPLKGVVHGFHIHIGHARHQFPDLVRIRVIRHLHAQLIK